MTDTLRGVGGISGLQWYGNGQSAFSGELLDLFRKLDALFLRWASESGAAEHVFPTFIPATALAKLDYFHSFPHLVTFPVVLDASETNLKQFAAGDPINSNGELQLADLA